MAAAARAPGPAEARTPCPLCGGLIHPIAGRCKHCKADLSALRTSLPAAAAALPPLHPPVAPPVARAPGAEPAPAALSASPPGYAPPLHGASTAPAQLARTQAVVALPVGPVVPIDATPILPPRPTGRHLATAPRASWKSWPVIVIALAVIAIVTAVVLMVWPPGSATADAGTSSRLLPPPAPERMETDPVVPPAPRAPGTDPWRAPPADPGAGSAPGARGVDPTHPAGPGAPDPMPPSDPGDPDDSDDPNARAPSGSAASDPFVGLGLGPSSGAFMFSMMRRACTRLSQCGSVDDTVQMLCDGATSWPSAAPPTCPAAQRCLRHIDAMSCDGTNNNSNALFDLISKFSDCTDAMKC